MVVLYLVVLKNHMLAKIIKKNPTVCSIWVCTDFRVWGEHAFVCMCGEHRWMLSVCACDFSPYLF